MEDKTLNVIEHLEELRRRIIISALSFLVFLIIGLFFVKKIYLFFMGSFDDPLLILGPGDIMWIFFHIACVFAFAGTTPIVAYQLWMFVKPGLQPQERRVTLAYIPGLFILFIAGLGFGYYFVFPNLLNFLINLGKDMMVTSFTAEKYFDFLIKTTLPFGIAFELPLVMMFLTSIGVLNPHSLTKLRKYAYFILVIIASMISPPEFISHISVAVPLILIYEISIILSKVVFNRRRKRQRDINMKGKSI